MVSLVEIRTTPRQLPLVLKQGARISPGHTGTYPQLIMHREVFLYTGYCIHYPGRLFKNTRISALVDPTH